MAEGILPIPRHSVFSDHINVFWEHRKAHSDTWMTLRDGVFDISDMTTIHIENCIAMLIRIDQMNCLAYVGLTRELLKRISEEQQNAKS